MAISFILKCNYSTCCGTVAAMFSTDVYDFIVIIADMNEDVDDR